MTNLLNTMLSKLFEADAAIFYLVKFSPIIENSCMNAKRSKKIFKSNYRAQTRSFLSEIFLCLAFALLFSNQKAHADSNSKNKAQPPEGRIGRGSKKIQRQTCLLPVEQNGLNFGDLAEVIDVSSTRIAIVRLEKMNQSSAKLVAKVLSGEDKCTSLAGFKIRPLSTDANPNQLSAASSKQTIIHISPQYLLTQNSLPGLALNKFLNPGYTQRGFALRTAGIFPREPMKVGSFELRAMGDLLWSTATTTPPLDLVRNGKVLGSQSFSTQNLQLRAGAYIPEFSGRAWSSAGLILFDSFRTQSSLLASGSESTDQIFKVIRDISGQGFGLFAEQGILIGSSASLTVGGGIGLATSITTPLLEDGESTNTAEKFQLNGLPLYATARVHLPFLDWLFAEINLDYRLIQMQLPLINEQLTKAQYEVVGFSTGIGIRY
ncbi:hypothetical protein EBU99_13165 [bacterium]|nr:hypothetical protein [bacterium]